MIENRHTITAEHRESSCISIIRKQYLQSIRHAKELQLAPKSALLTTDAIHYPTNVPEFLAELFAQRPFPSLHRLLGRIRGDSRILQTLVYHGCTCSHIQVDMLSATAFESPLEIVHVAQPMLDAWTRSTTAGAASRRPSY